MLRETPAVIDAELRALVERYATAADERDAAGFAGCFTDDGVLITPRGELRGTTELATVPARLDRYDRTRHLVTDHRVHEVADELATGATWCTAEHLTIGDVCVETHVMTIRYDDRYERTPDGWRLARRTLVLLDEERRQGA